jgi:hypothetical protein
MKHFSILLVAILLSGCNVRPESKNEQPVARAFTNYLYPSDLEDVVPAGMTGSDSVELVQDFIEKWIRNQLLLNKAEINLTESEKDVELQIESYRSSLLIYAYQQSYLRQKLDTVVTDKEIEDYYKQNISNFILNGSMFKGIYIKVPSKAPELWRLRQWYRSDDPESIKNLEGYCFRNAAVYNDFEEDWVRISDVLQMLPMNGTHYESALASRKYLETRDNEYNYFVSAKEIALEGTVSPFELVKNDIQYIILNKRKIMLINELEMSIYSDAQNHEYFNIYKK